MSLEALPIFAVAVVAASLAKSGIDLLKIAVKPPRWAPPVLALLLGTAFVVLLLVSAGKFAGTPADLANVAIGGFIAATAAVGITEMQARARQE